MRVSIVVAVLIVMTIVDTTSARGCYAARNAVRNIDKSIYNSCNKDAYHKTNNIELYKCFRVNNTNNCMHLDNVVEYNNIMKICILDNNASMGAGVLFSLMLVLIISLCSMA
jgi:hypothetical protein